MRLLGRMLIGLHRCIQSVILLPEIVLNTKQETCPLRLSYFGVADTHADQAR